MRPGVSPKNPRPGINRATGRPVGSTWAGRGPDNWKSQFRARREAKNVESDRAGRPAMPSGT